MSDLRAIIAAVKGDGKSRNLRCPAHDDQRASLSVSLGHTENIVLFCHAGCTFDSIREAGDLLHADLFARRDGGGNEKQIVATYDYRNERGDVQFQVVRYEPKDFRQRRPDGHGGWNWNTKGMRPLPYALDRIHDKHDSVLIVEGEKDAERLWQVGLPATCNVGGAGKWKPQHARALVEAGVQAVGILPDNDEPGRKHGLDVARSCHTAGLRVRIIALPGLLPKGDVSDWFDAGHTPDELTAIARASAVYEPVSADTIELTRLGDLLAEPDESVDYLVADRIACGSVNALAGKPKCGKSTTARVLALEVSRGGVWLGFACLPRPVWYLALEDKRSEVRRHFKQMGATGAEPVRFLFRQPTDGLLTELHALAAREHPGLIVVDTLQRLIRADDLNDYAEVTTKLTPILTLARETNAAVLLVHHAGKSDRAGIDAVLGSTALTGSVDNVFILSRTERYRVLSSVQRIGPDLPETVLTLDEAGQVQAGQSRHDADITHVMDAMLRVLSMAGGVTRHEWLAACEGRQSLKVEALRRLVEAGTAIRHGAGTKSDPYRHYFKGDKNAGTQVPPRVGVPESSVSLFHENASEFKLNAGTQVPGSHAEQDDDADLRRF